MGGWAGGWVRSFQKAAAGRRKRSQSDGTEWFGRKVAVRGEAPVSAREKAEGVDPRAGGREDQLMGGGEERGDPDQLQDGKAKWQKYWNC